MIDLRAILVCVDYSDLLEITLPYNLHHFSEVMIVTSLGDWQTQALARRYPGKVKLFITDLFYAGGAYFNKWLALETALDTLGRHGWLCIMDADILWPKDAMAWQDHHLFPESEPRSQGITPGYLYTPYRYMMEDVQKFFSEHYAIPDEISWHLSFPLHPQQREFAGFTQIFHADDPVLGPAPWHQVDWKHAGGADSFFQQKWPENKKIRPPFKVLHLGPAGQNWCGRATQRLDGSVPADGEEKKQALRDMIRARKAGPNRFEAEKLSGPHRPPTI